MNRTNYLLKFLGKHSKKYLIALLIVGSSSTPVVFAQDDAVAASLAALETVAESEDCVLARNVRNIDIVNNELLVLRGRADRWWVSRLPNKCPGLRDRMLLSIDRYGSQICRNDRFEAHETGGGFYTSCRFGAFEPVTEGSIQAIKVAAANG